MSPDVLATVAQCINTLNQRTGALQPWVLYPHQLDILQAAATSSRLIILKARQLGSSSICTFYMLMRAISQPGFQGGIVADNYANATGLLDKIKDYCAQLGLSTTTENARRITLTNGSSLEAITVNSGIGKENKAGRSRTYHALLLSECAYYANSFAVFASLTSALVPGGQIIIESTATPGPTIFRHIWDSDTAGYDKLFFSCEQHPNYHADPDSITDDQWLELQTVRGFTSRSAAAFWHQKLHTDFGGDIQRLLREYPVLPEHSWAAASGRWIHKDPVVATPTSMLDQLEQYQPIGFGSHYVIGVDVAAGVGRDSSAIVVWDLVRRRIAGLWSSSTVHVDGLAAVIKQISAHYQPHAVYIERNGIGGGILGLFADSPKIPVIMHTTTESTKYAGLLRVKRDIETSGVCANAQFSNEAQALTYDLVGTKEKFSHAGDTLMALSLCLLYEPDHAYVLKQPAPRPPVPHGSFDMDRALKKAAAQNKKESRGGYYR